MPYLAQLGVSHVYLSPFLTAAPGSPHGYDQADPTGVDPALGGLRGYRRLRRGLEELGLELLTDVVPNHMAIAAANHWWEEALARGPHSAGGRFFDISWRDRESRSTGKVVLPFLPRRYGRMLAAGELRLVRTGRRVVVRVGETTYPISPASLTTLRREFRATFGQKAAPAVPAVGEAAERDMDLLVAAVNADPIWLDRLLQAQHFRLARWQARERELNYRRFFDVDSLVGVRIEDERVYHAHHDYLLGILKPGDGLRVDHPDGLRDPEGYLRRLRDDSKRRWIVVEKILGRGEQLPRSWPVDGTTGYDFGRLVNGLFVAQEAEGELTQTYARFTGEERSYEEVEHLSKREVVWALFGSDLNRLSDQLQNVTGRSPWHRDFGRHELREALAEVAAALPVYRTYLADGMGRRAVRDATAPLRAAIRKVQSSRPDLDPDLLSLIGDVLGFTVDDPEARDLALRFQQLSGAVMAKGVEDTAFYRYHRLISLNEVGDDPGHFGVAVPEFHRAMELRQSDWPLALNATSTHDSKRSEDVRCRIDMLSLLPSAWALAVRRWARLTDPHRQGPGLPDRNFEYFLYQTLLGAWPISEQRLLTVVQKSVREAKVHTSWRSPEPRYEESVRSFTRGALHDPAFIRSLAAFLRRIERPARVASLAATLLKLTAPGVPDIYQGTEVWAHNLVDPDNRRPVDFTGLKRQLDLAGAGTPPRGRSTWSGGLPKQWLLERGLEVRRERASAFSPRARYVALAVHGTHAAHVVAFERGGQVVTVVPTRPFLGREGWGDTTIELGRMRWKDRLGGATFESGEVRVADLLRGFPVALLVAEAAP